MLAVEWGWTLLGRERGRWGCVKWGEEMKGEELDSILGRSKYRFIEWEKEKKVRVVGAVGENLMQANFKLMIKVVIHWMGKEEKSGVVGENLMPMEVGGIVVELFSYLFFTISLF